MKKIPIARPYIDAEDRRGVLTVLGSGMLSLGPKYQEFEQKMAKYVGTKYACAVANGTCGLHLVVKALNLKDGDEVITSPFSFVSSSNSLLFERATPVFVDIEDQTYNMDADKVEAAITSKTKAILVVHIFGQSAQMDKIIKIAKKYNLKIIEDACESLGSAFKDHMTGTMGDAGVYAFYPNKQMTTGEGGIIVTNSAKIYELCKSLRNQGRNSSGDWLIHERLGYNYRMDEMSASLGVTQLKKLDWMIDRKRKIVKWYETAFKNISGVMIPTIAPQRTHSWFVYVVRITNGRRNHVMAKLAEKGIQTKPYLPVIHLQPYMKKQFGYKKGNFPVAEKISSQTLALPFYIGLKKIDVEYVAREVEQALHDK